MRAENFCPRRPIEVEKDNAAERDFAALIFAQPCRTIATEP